MPMTRSKAMVFAGQACYGVETRQLGRLSSMRTASPAACKSARAILQKHEQQPTTWKSAILRSLPCTNSTQDH
eukprot:8653903-Pyramimonas_sp.AAC.1